MEKVAVRCRRKIKYVHEGSYVAEVDVDLIEDDSGWSPYLSMDDAYRLDEVREALRQGDLRAASNFASIFEMRPVVPE